MGVIIEPAHLARIASLPMAAYGLSDREKDVTRLVLQCDATDAIAGSILASISGAIWCGHRSGRELRSARAPSPRGVANQPPVHRAPVHTVAGGHVGDPGAVQRLPHRQVALLNHRKLREHPEILLGSPEPK